MITAVANGEAKPDPEVVERAKRRHFDAEYKLSILEAFESCESAMERGALLRREGLYRSHISKWREQSGVGALAALATRKRGRKPTKRRDAVAVENAQLRREKAELERKLKRAELLLEIQKKLSEAMGIPLTGVEAEKDENE